MHKCLVLLLLAAASAQSNSAPLESDAYDPPAPKATKQVSKPKKAVPSKPAAPQWDNMWLRSGVQGQPTPIPLLEALRALVPERMTLVIKSNVDTSVPVTWGPGTIVTALNEVTFQARAKFSLPENGYVILDPELNVLHTVAAPTSGAQASKIANGGETFAPDVAKIQAATKPVAVVAPAAQTKPQPMRNVIVAQDVGQPAITPTKTSAAAQASAPVVDDVSQAKSMPALIPPQADSPATMIAKNLANEAKPVTVAATPALPSKAIAMTSQQSWWTIHKGQKFSDGLAEWGEKAGVNVTWDTGNIRAKTDIEVFGTFDEALLKFLQGTDRAGVHLRVKNFSNDGKRRIVVWEKN